MITASSILAWEILWTVGPGGLVLGVAESDTTEQVTSFSLIQRPRISWGEVNNIARSFKYYQCSQFLSCGFLGAQEILLIPRSLTLFILLT